MTNFYLLLTILLFQHGSPEGKYFNVTYFARHKFIETLKVKSNGFFSLESIDVSKDYKTKVKGDWSFESDSTIWLTPKLFYEGNKKHICSPDSTSVFCNVSLFYFQENILANFDNDMNIISKTIFER